MASSKITDKEKYEIAYGLVSEGKYKEAIKLAETITNRNELARAAIFIDAGLPLKKLGLVRNAARCFERATENVEGEETKLNHLYNAANGYKSAFDIRRMLGKTLIPPNDLELKRAKHLYREAIAFPLTKENKSLRSRILVNYGNCLSAFGRGIEAIEAYRQAAECEPENGMAWGNLGIELDHVSRIMGKYRHEYIRAAYDALKRAMGDTAHLNYGSSLAKERFHKYLIRLQHLISAHQKGIPELRKIGVPKTNKKNTDYLSYCIENDLFLNAWVGSPEFLPAIQDEVGYGSIADTVGSTMIQRLVLILNEIKESYSTSRYLLYLSQTENAELNYASKLTLYDTFVNDELYGTQFGLLKTAYARAFDILDKVARIVNVYFQIGDEMKGFWSTCATKQSSGATQEIVFVARQEIVKTMNYSLFALADLCIDYFESEHVDFKQIDKRRNKITHDCLVLSYFPPLTEDLGERVELRDFYKQTLKLMKLAKFATLYAISAVSLAETQNVNDSNLPTFSYQSIPGIGSDGLMS
jgi:tetratricopeptide (TPR) repeat protein